MLLGGLVAVGLSGVLAVQTFVYLKLYSKDSAQTKFIVCSALQLYSDLTHCPRQVGLTWFVLRDQVCMQTDT